MKEKKGRGTGIGTLMPTWPTSILCLNFLADFPEAVKIEVPLPNGLLLINLERIIPEEKKPRLIKVN